MTDNSSAIEPAIAAGRLLREVARLHLQLQRATVTCCQGTTLTQCTILTELGRNGAATLIELSRRIGFDKSWTSRAVDNLVGAGLVLKVGSELDRRTVQIKLSPAGHLRYTQLDEALNNQASSLLTSIPQEQQQQVYQALALLQAAMQTAKSGQLLNGEPSTLACRKQNENEVNTDIVATNNPVREGK